MDKLCISSSLLYLTQLMEVKWFFFGFVKVSFTFQINTKHPVSITF